MALRNSSWKWLLLSFLMIAALAFEPIRSGFTFANQSCEVVGTIQQVKLAFFNLRHIISFCILCLAATLVLGRTRLMAAAAGTLLFSAFLEFEQSFFTTGHCRLWDMIPNVLGVFVAALILVVGFQIQSPARAN